MNREFAPPLKLRVFGGGLSESAVEDPDVDMVNLANKVMGISRLGWYYIPSPAACESKFFRKDQGR